jgi:hypothetical protein
VTVDRDAVAEPEEEAAAAARRKVWEVRCRVVVGRVREVVAVECGCLGDRTGIEENCLHRTDVVSAKRSTVPRTKTAGRCMECSVSVPVKTEASSDDPNCAGPNYGTHAALRHTKSQSANSVYSIE